MPHSVSEKFPKLGLGNVTMTADPEEGQFREESEELVRTRTPEVTEGEATKTESDKLGCKFIRSSTLFQWGVKRQTPLQIYCTWEIGEVRMN